MPLMRIIRFGTQTATNNSTNGGPHISDWRSRVMGIGKLEISRAAIITSPATYVRGIYD